MIVFPNAKINLGLYIVEKRADGFHNIETVFYPAGWCDVLEVVENRGSLKAFDLHLSGLPVSGSTEDNILYKAYQLINKVHVLPNISVYLHKVIPMGAGLGGGSADAAFFISMLNGQFNLGFSEEQQTGFAKQLGSDCAFFIRNRPVYATQKGDVFEDIEIKLQGYHLAIVYPNVNSNTREAYSLVKPHRAEPLRPLLSTGINQWKTLLKNDFEPSIFSKYPVVQQVKEQLYGLGASYACMSGSGSAVFGIFTEVPVLGELERFPHWIGPL